MVRLFVAVTDQSWFDQLSATAPHDEVNFWRPSGDRTFKALEPGELLLFKLRAPNNVIAGGGVFSHASNVPLSLAWEAFGLKNGVNGHVAMRELIGNYRTDGAFADARHDPVVGCRILTQPFFWPREAWIKVPDSWSPTIVAGKGYDTASAEGAGLWHAVSERLTAAPAAGFAEAPARYGTPTLITPRLGQGAFRLTVTDSYERRCAVTGEKTLPILDAAHIKSFAAGGQHAPSNGLLLRTDIHRLFDLGYVTVDGGGRFAVSRRLRADFDNGRHYYDLQGTQLRLPAVGDAHPSAEALDWHRTNRFLD